MAEWLRTELPKLLEANYRKPTQVEIPILALRFTHNNVNASLAFGDSHENNQENILKLFDQMFRNRVKPHEVEHLCVKLPQSLDDEKGSGLETIEDYWLSEHFSLADWRHASWCSLA